MRPPEMKSTSRKSRRVQLFVAVLLLGLAFGCSNPLGRFSKQYKCQIPGKAEPRTPYEFVERSSEHMRMDQVECALAACEEAIRLDSKQAPGYACRGGILGQKADYRAALKDLNYAIKLQPENGDYYHQRAVIHDYLNNMDQAMADVTKATELQGSEFSRSLSFAFRARLYRKQSKNTEAANDYSEAIKLSPDFSYHWGNRGAVYVELKDYNKAIADFDEAIRLDPRNQYFRRDRAKAYRATGRNDLAAQDEVAVEALASGGGAEASTSPSPASSQQEVSIAGGELKGKAISLPKPAYPPAARAVRASGTVLVDVNVNANGEVTDAEANAGHPLLRAAAVAAAREAKFQPSSGQIRGTIVYVFSAP